MDEARAADAGTQPLRRWWLTRRLHIDLLRVCSAFGPRG
ncbi:cell envelope biogenesis protein OmpA [Streptomyces sp. NBC_00555]|nr:cell envelope biogenesis protein OmpA [Streptomyces sp. NBC_00555]MCX5016295.1 cell envelope biogenesis protein OmpA [Streptomyces sp. NBC_00555]